MNNIDFNSTTALKTAEALENIARRTKKCRIALVKAHIGTEGNEAADEPAREGAENKNNILQIRKTPPPPGMLKKFIDTAVRAE